MMPLTGWLAGRFGLPDSGPLTGPKQTFAFIERFCRRTITVQAQCG